MCPKALPRTPEDAPLIPQGRPKCRPVAQKALYFRFAARGPFDHVFSLFSRGALGTLFGEILKSSWDPFGFLSSPFFHFKT